MSARVTPPYVLLLVLALALVTPLYGGPVEDWIALEHRRIDRSVDPRLIVPPDVENQRSAFRPDRGRTFPLKSIWLPEDELDVALAEREIPRELRSELIRTRNHRRYFRLFIHPESESFYAELMKKYPVVTEHEATSTSSSRSVLVRSKSDPSKRYFVKLSLDVELGGVRRTIPRGEVARSVGTYQYLATQRQALSPAFRIMPEVVGIIPKGWERGGQIIRLIPKEVEGGTPRLVPMFSLTAPGARRTLLEELAARAGLSAKEFARQKILEPFLAAWTDWAEKGVVMEAHAQNFLLELGGDGLPTGRFFHRDLGGFNIDSKSPFVDKKALSGLPYFDDFAKEYHQRFSRAALEQSLGTYFSGGVLFNLDRVLREIDPSYRPREVYSIAARILAEAVVARPGGARLSASPKSLLEDYPGVILELRRRAKRACRYQGLKD